MSITFKDNTDEVLSALEKAIQNGLTAIGMTAEGHAKREITKLVYSRGDKEKRYRLTGRLRNSITYAVSGQETAIRSYRDDDGNEYSYDGIAPDDREKGVYIGTNVEYAPYVELGTVKMQARPFLRPAATEHSEEYKRIMEAALKSAEE